MIRERVMWAAGVYEGEGHVRQGHTFCVEISMTDLDVLESFRDTFGVGKVYARSGTHKKAWRYMANGRNAYAVLVAMLPFLHERRKADAISAIQQWLPKQPRACA